MDSFLVIFTSEASIEISDSFYYYEKQKKDLGLDFIFELDIILARITFNPKQFRKNANGFQEALVSRYPFLVVYEILENEIHILSVYHTKRKPNY
jgi:hypothetical protein